MRSLRLRFGMLAAAMVAGIVAVLGSGIYIALDRRLHDQIDSRLVGRASGFDRIRPIGPPPDAQSRVVAGPGRRGGGPLYFGVDASGNILFRTPGAEGIDLHIPDDALRESLAGKERLITVTAGGQPYRVDLARPSPELDTSPLLTADVQRAMRTGLVIAAAQSLQGVSDTLDPLRLLLVGSVIAGLLLGAAGGLGAANRALLPLSRLSSEVASLGTDGDLTRRLAPPPGHDEVGALAGAFNASLDRIEVVYRELERLLERQRRFVADASHELRTPLTVMRSDLAMLEKYPEMPGADRRVIVARSRGEAERMTKLAGDLLEQARSETPGSPDTLAAAVNWDAVHREIAAELSHLVAPRPVSATLGAVGDGRGDGEVLRRIVRILAENIVRHTPPSSHVTVRVAADADRFSVTVADDGPGVDESFLPAIFDRFARGDTSRTVAGTGLGLAIARALVLSHGGTIEAAANHPGLRFTVRLPIGGRPASP